MFFKNELSKRKSKVHIPAVYSDMTSQRIITTEWINGVKLVDAPKNKIKELIPVGVELFLTQLLDIGAFHSDPVSLTCIMFKDMALKYCEILTLSTLSVFSFFNVMLFSFTHSIRETYLSPKREIFAY